MARDILAKLFAILEDERRALLTARYDALPGLAAQKDKYLRGLELTPPAKTTLQALKTKMRENQDLITAALRGVEAARKRITALEDVRDRLTTYDPSGNMSLMPNTQKTFEKKA